VKYADLRLVAMRRRDPDLVEDPDRGSLRRRLHDPRQHRRPERLIGNRIEPEPAVRVDQDIPQDLAGRAGHHRPT
jgi:hypothetical protein